MDACPLLDQLPCIFWERDGKNKRSLLAIIGKQVSMGCE